LKTKIEKRVSNFVVVIHVAAVVAATLVVASSFVVFLVSYNSHNVIFSYLSSVVHCSVFFYLTLEFKSFKERKLILPRLAVGIQKMGYEKFIDLIDECRKDIIGKFTIRFIFSSLGIKEEYKIMKKKFRLASLDKK
jgi:hypothetical protein